jgi:hypothetical protein
MVRVKPYQKPSSIQVQFISVYMFLVESTMLEDVLQMHTSLSYSVLQLGHFKKWSVSASVFMSANSLFKQVSNLSTTFYIVYQPIDDTTV